MKRGWVFPVIILSFITVLFLIRAVSPTQIDDVSPEVLCKEIEIYNPDVLYVIPNYNQNLISENKSWCDEILSLNKTLGLHGINHSPYREFLTENISQEDLDFVLESFRDCFNQTPKDFKPPQLKISEENRILVEENNLTLKLFSNSLFHKVYHCGDEGRIKNKLIRIF